MPQSDSMSIDVQAQTSWIAGNVVPAAEFLSAKILFVHDCSSLNPALDCRSCVRMKNMLNSRSAVYGPYGRLFSDHASYGPQRMVSTCLSCIRWLDDGTARQRHINGNACNDCKCQMLCTGKRRRLFHVKRDSRAISQVVPLCTVVCLIAYYGKESLYHILGSHILLCGSQISRVLGSIPQI
jgi:hypothetical protein